MLPDLIQDAMCSRQIARGRQYGSRPFGMTREGICDSQLPLRPNEKPWPWITRRQHAHPFLYQRTAAPETKLEEVSIAKFRQGLANGTLRRAGALTPTQKLRMVIYCRPDSTEPSVNTASDAQKIRRIPGSLAKRAIKIRQCSAEKKSAVSERA